MIARIRALGRRLWSVVAVIALLGATLTVASWGHDPDPLAARELTDSTMWVTTASEGLIHDLDSTVGRAGPPLRVDGGSGADLETVQAGADGYVINHDTASVRFIDASSRTFGRSWEFGAEGRISFHADDRIGWAYIGEPTNVLQRVVPGLELAQLGDPIPISADGDDAALESSGSIVVPDEQNGTVARVSPSGQVTEAPEPVSQPGNDLAVVLVDDRPVVLDRTAADVIVLDEDLSRIGQCSLGMTGVPFASGGQGRDGRLALLSPEQGLLVVIDLETCDRSRESATLGAGDEFGVPLLVDGAVYVPNFTAGIVQIVEIGGDLGDDLRVIETEELGLSSGRFELLTEHELVVFNDPASAVAGIVGRDGVVIEHVKFVRGENGMPSSDPGAEQEAELDEGSGGVAPAENQGDQADDDQAPDEPQPNPPPATPDPNPTPDPSPNPDPDRDPAGPEIASPLRVSCQADRTDVEVGGTVTFSVATSGTGPERVGIYEFDIDGSTRTSVDGALMVQFDQAGTPEIIVRGQLVAGGATAPARCPQVTVGDAPQPPAQVRCGSSVGAEGQIDQDITFFAEFPDGTVSWEWDFGGGDVSGEEAPVRRFGVPGTVDVSIRVDVTGAGQTEAECPVTITAGAPDLVPSIAWNPARVIADEPIEFTSTTLNAEAISSYRWSFPGATPDTADTPTVAAVTWPAPGPSIVELTVTNADGAEFTVEQTVTVQPAPTGGTPPPDVAIDRIGNLFVGDTMPLSYRTLEGSPVTSSWEILRTDDVGEQTLMATLRGSTTSFTIPSHAGGAYEVILTVTDAEGRTGTDTETLSVLRPLTPDFTFSPTTGPATVEIGTAINFSGTSASSNVDSWEWNFGGGNTGTGQTATHTFTSAGSVTVTLTVSNAAGSASISKTITVNDTSGDVMVPDVRGMTRAAAITALTGLGLDPNPQTDTCAPAVPLDQVIAQTIAAGQLVSPGAAVGISVSDGTDWQMPTLAESDAGSHPSLPLTVNVVKQSTNNPAEDGVVLGQAPDVGTRHCGQVAADVFVGELTVVPPPQLGCDSNGTYQVAITCTAQNNPNGGTIEWGDGATSPVAPSGSATHPYGLVGSVTPRLVHDGTAVDANSVAIAPDFSGIDCTSSGTLTQWQLEDVGGNWDYALDGGGDRIQLADVPNTTTCTANSAALSALGGSVAWSVAPTGAAAVAGSQGGAGVYSGATCCQFAWSGGQPASLSMTVTVNGVGVNRSTQMYLSGCG